MSSWAHPPENIPVGVDYFMMNAAISHGISFPKNVLRIRASRNTRKYFNLVAAMPDINEFL
jgi:hypothetical protein